VRARTAKGVAALQLSTRRPGNEPSRSLGLLPNKIYIRIQGGRRLFFFTSPYIILGALALLLRLRFSVVSLDRGSRGGLIYRGFPMSRGIV